MSNSVKKYHKSEIAREQLRTAVRLFLNQKDLSSVITLAAAASNILYQLVCNANKEAFIDYACRVHDAFQGSTPNRMKYKNYIENCFGVNVHKHMGPNCPKTCTLNLHESADNMLLIAISDYVTLYGQKEDFVRAYLHWRWDREDGVNIVKLSSEMPEKLKKTEKWRKQVNPENLKKKSYIVQNKLNKKSYQRFQLATNQLETSIMLFLTNIDKLSAITLAGASDVILCELVNREEKKNFTDILCEKEGGTRTREEIGNEINNILSINALKHFDKGEYEHIDIDVEECAVAAILRALANYSMLDGKDDKLICAFRCWVKINLGSKYNLGVEPE